MGIGLLRLGERQTANYIEIYYMYRLYTHSSEGFSKFDVKSKQHSRFEAMAKDHFGGVVDFAKSNSQRDPESFKMT